MFKIVTDSMSDLPKQYLEEHEIDTIFMPYSVGERSFDQSYQMDAHEFYTKMREGVAPQTSAITFEKARSVLG